MNVNRPTHIWLLIGTSFASLTRNKLRIYDPQKNWKITKIYIYFHAYKILHLMKKDNKCKCYREISPPYTRQYDSVVMVHWVPEWSSIGPPWCRETPGSRTTIHLMGIGYYWGHNLIFYYVKIQYRIVTV